MTKQILFLIPAGAGTLDELRAKRLIQGYPADITFHITDRTLSRSTASRQAAAALAEKKWDFVCMEGSGSIGGIPLIQAARKNGQKYLVSFGDPISNFFRTTKGQVHGLAFEVYERLLYHYSTGIVGWTPYITGRAVNMGAPRAATVEGGVDTSLFVAPSDEQRKQARRRVGIPENHIVCGMVGSMRWSQRQSYCYGLELVKMFSYLQRQDISLLLVGDGDGRRHLEELVTERMKERVHFAGRVSAQEVPAYMHCMDIGFVTQTLDGLGSFRLTTKLPEYLASSVAVAISPIPGYFDYVGAAGWPLPPYHPASDAFHRASAHWLDTLDREEIEHVRANTAVAAERFHDELLIVRFHNFLRYCVNLSS